MNSAAIDTTGNKVVATVPVGQAPQAIAYVPNAVPTGPAPTISNHSARPARLCI